MVSLLANQATLLTGQMFGDYEEEDDFEIAPEPRRKTEEQVQARKDGPVAFESTPKTDQYETADSEEASGGETGITKRKRKLETVVETTKQKKRNKKRHHVSEDGPTKRPPPAGLVPEGLLPEDKNGICVEKPNKLGYRKWKVGVFELGFALVPIVKEKH